MRTPVKKLADRWASKTEMEKADYLALLMEILGADLLAAKVGAMQAKKVKDIIAQYPKNRNKNPVTRGKPLAEVMAMTGIETISLTSVNKCLQSYNDLFEWGRKQGHLPENRFSGLSIQQRKDGQKGKRDAFSNENIRFMLDVLTGKRAGLIELKMPYQKWGPLIGIYTGARLNEICQLEIADMREQDGIWCFDINADGDGKHVKTEASKRLVPIHRQLIQLGFLDYIEERRKQKQPKVFSDFSYSAQNGWGRNLGRWFNERFLPALGLKAKGQSFHSLRHTANTRLLQANVEITLVKSLIGHEQDGMTVKQYFGEGYTLEQRNEALQKLNFQQPERRTGD
ncbi:integrase [Rhizobium sp. OAE497]